MVRCLASTNCATELTSHKAEEAQKSVRGLGENAIHQKYVELVCTVRFARIILFFTPSKFAEMKRIERDHSKEKQKLQKDKDTGSQLSSMMKTSSCLSMTISEEPVNESKPSESEIGELRSRPAEGTSTFNVFFGQHLCYVL